ncbi:MAG: DUF4301 family protein [Marinilabiliales bacterium]|nr:MAG: DUF4301 family protein [Marinilabiliales bacterium]
MFTEQDKKELRERGISLNDAEKQLTYFQNGFPYLSIVRPATAGDGILKPRPETLDDFVQLYNSASASEKIIKFVPASGAATRMFKDLHTFLEDSRSGAAGGSIPEEFIGGLKRFAFFDKLKESLEKKGMDPELLIKSGEYAEIINTLLSPGGLDYASIPKGLILFHKYDDGPRTAFEEHLVEAALYCRDRNGLARIHLTVSPEHLKAFSGTLENARGKYGQYYDTKYEVEFSTQKRSTDTIAADADNKPFRDSDGRLVFRPGGHGALLENLGTLDAGIIFIKNIDNVVPDDLKDESVRYKKALGGMLISFRGRIFDYLNELTGNKKTDRGHLEEILTFLQEELSVVTPWGADQWDDNQLRRYLVAKLNRPLRICGMVENAGEPGGGPFWVKNSDDSVSLQILESSQINLSNPLMKKLFDASTHFNPVDIVCSTTDYRGRKFDLVRHRDENAGFISRKSMGIRELKALELPGLWNGSMSDWNTVFVEVPLSTFTPVKTITDLLRPEHSVK